MRLQKFLSQAGICSRREAEKHIQDGLVKVNNKVVTELGSKIDPQKDQVKFKNQIVMIEENSLYILLHKPKGYLSTCKDTHDRKTILDLIPYKERLYPIGRLDKDTEGIIILSNDGELTYKLTHPKHKIEKEYYVECKGQLDDLKKKRLEKGVMLEGRKTQPCKIRIIETIEKLTKLKITIQEGRKRQIRNMFEIVGHRVHYLKRIRIGHIKIAHLKKGYFRKLSKKEIKGFLKD